MTPEDGLAPGIIKDLGGGLVMRRAHQEDAERLATFNAEVFRNLETGQPDSGVAGWVRDLMSGEHPTFRPGDFMLVEDTQRQAIASALCLISQVWSYSGIELGVGRVEIVGTNPDYRRRGLVRALMAELHQQSARRGELMQAITGIPWYYRQFGYDLALEWGGGRAGNRGLIPRLREGQSEPYTVRPAGEEHISFISWLYDHSRERYRVVTEYSDALWRYEVLGQSDESDVKPVWRVIVAENGQLVGALRHANRNWGNMLGVHFYELSNGYSYGAVTPSVLRYLEAQGDAYVAPNGPPWSEYYFVLGADHPVYAAWPSRMPMLRRATAWYIRIPDLPAFITRIAPALERNLAASALAGHSGEMKISSYTDGLRLLFQDGRIAGVEPWQPAHIHDGDASFPGLSFYQLLLGYRSLEDIEYALADSRVRGEGPRALLEALFPRQQSLAQGIV